MSKLLSDRLLLHIDAGISFQVAGPDVPTDAKKKKTYDCGKMIQYFLETKTEESSSLHKHRIK